MAHSSTFSTPPQEREEEKEPTLSSRVAWLLLGDAGDAGAGPGQAFERWLALVRRRSRNIRSRSLPLDFVPSPSHHPHSDEGLRTGEPDGDSVDLQSGNQASDMSLLERLGNAAVLDIESNCFSWSALSSLHHTEHSSSTDQSEDEMNKALEVTVNSGGVVFFALFNTPENNDLPLKEAAAVIKIASSRMATQSERLGYEFAKWLGVQTPQARVVHHSTPEWQWIKDAAEKARDVAVSSGDEVGELTCMELSEALELSRCLFLMNYVHGSPLLESSKAFDTCEAARNTAAALGRVLMLDLILRNEDRLPCRLLGWRGNSANLLFVDEVACAKLDSLDEAYGPPSKRYNPTMIRALQKGRRASSTVRRIGLNKSELLSPSDSFNESSHRFTKEEVKDDTRHSDFYVVAIDSGVPRRPPAGKRAKDHECYPKVVELVLNNSEYSSNLLHEISGGRLGAPVPEEAVAPTDLCSSLSDTDMATVVHEFQGGFRAALRDMQGFHIFLLTLYQKLEGLLRVFLSIISKGSSECDKDDFGTLDSPSHASGFGFSAPSPASKERVLNDAHADSSDSEKSGPKSFSSGCRENPDSASPVPRENLSGRHVRGCGDHARSLRLTMKLRDFNKCAKVDPIVSKELEQWNDMLRMDVIKLCQENNFNTGFFEGNDSNIVVDAYELKVRLEHILERIALICDAANTERLSHVMGNLFIGGALAARSKHTLQYLGITHILCLCSNEIGQSDSQYPDLFEYRNFSISDNDDENVSDLFEEACDFIDYVDHLGGKILVHCFEGRSRSATIVLAYLMLRKGLTLSEAWNMLKKSHRRAQPNDGFAKALVDLDKRLHGKTSMEWQHRKPAMKVCPICGKNVGLSSSSLKLHLQKSHKKISSGSVDSAMTMEIQKVVEGLKISGRGGSVSPTQKHFHSFADVLSN